MSEPTPEMPNNWELSRGISDIKLALTVITSGMLTQSMFAVEKAALTKADEDHGKEIGENRAEIGKLKEAKTLADTRAEEQRQRNRLFVYGLIFTPIVTAIVTWFAANGIRP